METNPDRWHPLEVRRALRCRGIPLESLRHKITPTNEHYLLIHWDVPETDVASWRLQIGGQNPLSLSVADLRARPAVSITVTLECAGNGRAFVAPRRISNPWHTEAVSTAIWTGVRLVDLLNEARALETPGTKEFVFSGVDRGLEADGKVYSYQRSMPADAVLDPSILIVYQMNGQDLPAVHGAPLRLVVPGWYGAASVKWLHRIKPIDYFFDHPKMRIYRDAQTEAETSTAPMVYQARVRAVLVPPGLGSFSRTLPRMLGAGPQVLTGRAWAGGGRWVTQVEVTTDGGTTWDRADVEAPELAHVSLPAPVDQSNGYKTLSSGSISRRGDSQPNLVADQTGRNKNGDPGVSPGDTNRGSERGNGDPGVSIAGANPGFDTQVGISSTRTYAWQKWTFRWDAPVGEAFVGVRATDCRGNVQPLSPIFNITGVGNNSVEMVAVVVVKDVGEGMPKQYLTTAG